MGEFSLRKWDKVEAYVKRFKTYTTKSKNKLYDYFWQESTHLE